MLWEWNNEHQLRKQNGNTKDQKHADVRAVPWHEEGEGDNKRGVRIEDQGNFLVRETEGQ